jgi:hypothetical protein
MKPKQKRNPKPIKPATTPGPVINRRKANKPFKPARGRFVERSAFNDPGPEDVTHFDAAPFDAAPYVEQLDTGGDE